MKKLLLSALLTLVMTAHAFATCTTGALPFNLQNNTVADATQVMANFNQIGTGVSANCAGSGANTDITSLGGLTTPLSTGEGGTWIWTGGTSAGTANAQTLATVTPATGFSLTQNKCVIFTAGFVNSGALTLNVFSTGAINVFRQTPLGPQAMTGGEVVVGQQTLVCYDGTQYELMSPSEQFGGVGAVKSIASAATVDLGTAGAHYVNVTGTTTITSFGSSASTTYPLYYVTFAGALTLTNNATSLILPGGANITTAANDTAWVLYLGSGNWQVTSYNKASGTAVVGASARGLIGGLNMSAAGASATISIGAGAATSDDFTINMSIAAFTKTTAGFTAGSGNGCLDTGAIATTTWYHFFLIENTSTVTTDILCSLSVSAPTLPSGFTKQRRIGASKTDGSSQWLGFNQNGDEFILLTSTHDTNNVTTTTASRTLYTLTVPTNLKVNALFRGGFNMGGGAGNIFWFTSPDENDQAPPTNAANGSDFQGVASGQAGGRFNIRTNTSAQIAGRSVNAGTLDIWTFGWIDTRGRNN